MPNRLQHETSPYLLQHANNPVDWYPWGEEAFAAAREQDKPVLLSVGYSACHWCHVMEHESFENPDTAAFMNEHFINIKVDREERPDVDDIYMQATLIFNQGNGGWPMTVFLTPEGHPFHAGTYFPPEPRYGMPSFQQVLETVLDTYRNKRREVERTARAMTSDLNRNMFAHLAAESDFITADLLYTAAQSLLRRADPQHGGVTRGQPKFPHPVNLEYLLRYHVATGDDQALQVVIFALRKMAEGGIYDQLGGGFHRYSVDERWLVPHFEKMLYDNAQLARVYLHAYQVTGAEFLREIVEDTLDYVLREMTSPDGGFFSTQDADSEGEEGQFFVWEAGILREVLDGAVNVNAVLEYWGVTDGGNFEGRNILHVADMIERVAVRNGMSREALQADISTARTLLFTLRKDRIAPDCDDKILTAWNGMMLATFAEAGRVLNHDDYRRAAIRNAQFLLDALVDQRGRFYRTHTNGVSKLNGYLEDYAHVIEGLLELYMTTFDPRWYREAERLAEIVLTHFHADKEGGFYDTSDDHDDLIVRPRNVQDNATPSGNGLMAYNLLRLTGFSAETRFEEAALGVFRAVGGALTEYPMAFGMMLIGVDFYVRRPQEIAIVGELADERTQAMLSAVRSGYRPWTLVAHAHVDADAKVIPALLRTRTHRNGKPATYVCENFVCKQPVTTADALRVQLKRPLWRPPQSVAPPMEASRSVPQNAPSFARTEIDSDVFETDAASFNGADDTFNGDDAAFNEDDALFNANGEPFNDNGAPFEDEK